MCKRCPASHPHIIQGGIIHCNKLEIVYILTEALMLLNADYFPSILAVLFTDLAQGRVDSGENQQ